MHGYKNVSPHNYPGVRLEKAGKRREHLWSSRQQSTDRAHMNQMAADWRSEAIKPPSDRKQIERRVEYEIREYSE